MLIWPSWVAEMVEDPGCYAAHLQDLVAPRTLGFSWLPQHDWILMETGNSDFAIDGRQESLLLKIAEGDAFTALVAYFFSLSPVNMRIRPQVVKQIEDALEVWGPSVGRDLFASAEGLSEDATAAMMLYFDVQYSLISRSKLQLRTAEETQRLRNLSPLVDRSVLRYSAPGGFSPEGWEIATYRDNDLVARALQWAASGGRVKQIPVLNPTLDRRVAKAVVWGLRRAGRPLHSLSYSFRSWWLLMRVVKRMPKSP